MADNTENNIAAWSAEERERVNIDLAASGVAYKERLNMPVVAVEVERQQPEHCASIFAGGWPGTDRRHRIIPEETILFTQNQKAINDVELY